jgi:hypothetical protein
MHLLLDILQAAGVSAAIGVRPFFPVIVVGALASQDLGVDFDGTQFVFLESPWFLLAVVAVLVVTTLQRRHFEAGAGESAMSGIAMGLAALEFAGQLDDRGSVWWPGLIAGALLAYLAWQASASLLARVRGRLDPQASGALFLYAEAFAIVLAGLSIAFGPLGLIGIGFLVFLLRGGRRRDDEKHAGLRTLR